MVKDDLIRRSDVLALVKVYQRSYGGTDLLVPFRAASEEDIKNIPAITDEELMTEVKKLYAAALEDRDAAKKIWEYVLNEFKVPEEVHLAIIASQEEMGEIRCRDCKHFTEGMAIGMCKRDPEHVVIPMRWDDYCSKAKRRADG